MVSKLEKPLMTWSKHACVISGIRTFNKARFGQARVSTPGGCASVRGRSICTSKASKRWAQPSSTPMVMSRQQRAGCAAQSCYLDLPSVGATENLMMAATLASGDFY